MDSGAAGTCVEEGSAEGCAVIAEWEKAKRLSVKSSNPIFMSHIIVQENILDNAAATL